MTILIDDLIRPLRWTVRVFVAHDKGPAVFSPEQHFATKREAHAAVMRLRGIRKIPILRTGHIYTIPAEK